MGLLPYPPTPPKNNAQFKQKSLWCLDPKIFMKHRPFSIVRIAKMVVYIWPFDLASEKKEINS